MTTAAEAWQAGIDAVVADNTLNRGGFADAIRTVLVFRFSNAEATDWIDAVAVEFERLGIINNPTYNNLRGHIIADPVEHRTLFDALATTLDALPESIVASDSAKLVELREDRDSTNDALARLDVLIAAEPAPAPVRRLVREILRNGKDHLRDRRERVKSLINALAGDPDA